MSKYAQRGPYHFIDYADPESTYHKHVEDLVTRVVLATHDQRWGVHEVGCGEGLILLRIRALGPFLTVVSGNEIDNAAVAMGRYLLEGLVIIDHTDDAPGLEIAPDVVLFCDSLEHMKTWREHLEWAKETAELVVIAVPSQPDRHADNVFGADSFDGIFKGWEIAHRATRHARHLSIYRRAP